MEAIDRVVAYMKYTSDNSEYYEKQPVNNDDEFSVDGVNERWRIVNCVIGQRKALALSCIFCAVQVSFLLNKLCRVNGCVNNRVNFILASSDINALDNLEILFIYSVTAITIFLMAFLKVG